VDLGLFNRYGRGIVRGAELYLRADIVLVAPRGKFAVRGPDVAFRAIDGLPLVLPPRPNSLVAALSDLALRHRITLNTALEAGSPALIHDAVAHAGLCTLVPQHLAQREYAGSAFVLARVVKPSLHQKTWLAYSTQRPASLAARVVGRLVRELAPALAD
jgi:DNA-binding transcriptional LysR family regulator